jgi:hypothetical protein
MIKKEAEKNTEAKKKETPMIDKEMMVAILAIHYYGGLLIGLPKKLSNRLQTMGIIDKEIKLTRDGIGLANGYDEALTIVNEMHASIVDFCQRLVNENKISLPVSSVSSVGNK